MTQEQTDSPMKIGIEDAQLIQQYFTEQEDLIKAIRKLFLGFDVDENLKTQIKQVFSDPKILALFWRRFCPSLATSIEYSSIGQLQDVWLGVEQMVFAQPLDSGFQAIQYKDRAISMTRQSLALLTDPHGERVNLAFVVPAGNADPYNIVLLARNMYIRNVEQQLSFIWIIASQAKITNPGGTKEKSTGKKKVDKDSVE